MLRIVSATSSYRAAAAAAARATAPIALGASSPWRSLKILAADPVDPVCAEVFRDAGHKLVEKKLNREELLALIPGYDGLVVRSGVKVTSDIIAAGVKLRVIGRAGAGVDNIDTLAATRRGVIVMNTPAVSSLKGGAWERKAFGDGVELKSKRVGIIGLGMIGVEVARRCQALDMVTVGYDPTLTPERSRALGVTPLALDDLFKSADFISVHTPLNASTKRLINADTLALCKRGVFIVNAARGGIVDEVALLQALESGHVGGAALDVFECEPPTGVSAELVAHPRVVCTPHVGASTEEAQRKVAREIADQMAKAFAGSSYTGVVNAGHLALARRPALEPYVRLAQALGSLHGQTWSAAANLKSTRVHVALEGPVFAAGRAALDLFKSSVLLGLLPALPALDLEAANLNLVNASLLADEAHVNVDVTLAPAPRAAWSNAITVTVTSPGGARVVVGSCVEGTPRVVQVDHWQSFPSFQPEGHVLLFNNLDRPGAVGRVTSTLADHNINIASLSVARQYPGSPALSVILCDSRIPSEVKAKIETLDGITNVRTASFGTEFVKPAAATREEVAAAL